MLKRPSVLLSLLTGLGAFALAVAANAAVPNAAVPAPPQATTWWTVVNISTVPGTYVDTTRPVASCTAGVGGTCTITRAIAVATTVQTSLGYSRSGVASSIGFSLTRTSTTTVSCSSPKLQSGQRYVGYSEGTAKHYRVQKWQGSSYPPGGSSGQLVGTSGVLLAYQPYNYPAIYCRVEAV